MEPVYGVSLGYFLWSLALGAAAGVFYDLFRIKRKIIHTPGLAVIIEDIVYFILTGVAVFLIAYVKNSGQLRWQGLIGICAGFFLYRLILKDIFVELVVKFIYLIVKCIKWLIKILIFPFRIVYKYILFPILVRPILWTGRKIRGIWSRICVNVIAAFQRKADEGEEEGEEGEKPQRDENPVEN